MDFGFSQKQDAREVRGDQEEKVSFGWGNSKALVVPIKNTDHGVFL